MIGNASLFSSLGEEDRAQVRQRCQRRSVARNEVVVHQGSLGREFYIVRSGRLRMSALSAEGKEVSFGVLEAGDTFGELSMLDGEARSATVTAIEPCQLLVMGRADFEALTAEQPRLAFNLLVILAQRLRHTSRVYEDSVFLDVSARLAKLLAQFARAAPDGRPPGRVFDLSLSQYELGSLINASRESVNKLLRDWELRRIIGRSAGRIRVLDEAALSALADGDQA